jgi:leader peptidase (prepilin peptidase)/N-methyltransferase
MVAAEFALRPYPAASNRRLATALAVLIVFASAALVTPHDWRLYASLVLGWALVCLAVIDARTFRLPDAFTLPLLALGLAVSVALPGRPWSDHLIGALLGWGVLRVLAWVWRRARGVDGIGLGDAKLLGAAGAWLGWAALPSVLLIACAFAFLWIALTVARGGRPALERRIAFGAPLCLAIWIVWLRGPLVL